MSNFQGAPSSIASPYVIPAREAARRAESRVYLGGACLAPRHVEKIDETHYVCPSKPLAGYRLLGHTSGRGFLSGTLTAVSAVLEGACASPDKCVRTTPTLLSSLLHFSAMGIVRLAHAFTATLDAHMRGIVWILPRPGRVDERHFPRSVRRSEERRVGKEC